MKERIKELTDIVGSLTDGVRNLLSGSGSTAQERKRVKTLDLNESIAQYKQQIEDIKAPSEIARKRLRISSRRNDLEELSPT